MTDTRERILSTALRLFAADGYEAVSVSTIAGELGMTKGALYKHFASKRAIFDSIVRRMEQRDAEQARDYDVPAGTLEEMEDAYQNTSIQQIAAFARAMFRYWTEDAFAAQFRKMLTLEQFRSEELCRLYQQYLVSGPLGYMADLFGSLGFSRPQTLAAEFYAPMFLLYSVYDGAENKASVTALLDACLDSVCNRLTEEMQKNDREQQNKS